ncbi:hypothetical protein CP352_02850 [Lactobacillus sp. UMNPBX1]|nr:MULTISPECIES: beta-galactosidase trimerization domain-containing protein [Lactobacillus]PEG82438.1 hypothetical protein CP367_08825 [Lactobacillus sp. UMNPBX16]PEG98398.1 hypothetical protein CP359_07450 [Lactobacillus sp. UMNPBX8]PEH12671.1 hypothetical protein CP352_02850 [Lactobacillus sp. UMNPBX1]
MSEKIVKGRDWAFIVYPESAPKNWREILDETHMRWVESPLHDKDFNPDGTFKKPHWHVMLSADGPITLKAVEKIIEPLNVPAPQKVGSGRGMIRYFIHLDNPEKYQYSRDEIVAHGGADVESYFELTKTNKISVMKDIITYIYENEIDNYADFLMICIQKSDEWFDVAINNNTLAINKMIDYQKWAKDQDIISYDSYPTYDAPAYKPAFLYDLMRSLKHQPFMLMESAPSQVNWQSYSPLKRPGQMAATELQAVAHGADTVQFFQLKQAVGGSEKFHSAIIAHSQRTDTRVFHELTDLGQKLKQAGSTILGSETKAKVAIIFDWSNFWSYEYVDGISQDLHYVDSILDYYRQFYERNIPTDVISVDDDFSQYDLVVAPVLYMVKTGLADKINAYVKNGGDFVTSYMSGMVNESDNVYLGGYPGPLKDVTGIWVEESDAVVPGHKTYVSLKDQNYEAGLVCDLIHPETAKVLAKYANEFYQGTAAITENQYGQGKAWYVGTKLDHAGLTQLFNHIVLAADIESLVAAGNQLEVTKRITKDGKELYFVLNMSNDERELPEKFAGYQDILTNQPAHKQMKAWDVQVLVK